MNKYNDDLFFYLFVEKTDKDVEQYLFSLGAKIRIYDFEANFDTGTKWPPVSALRLFVPYIIEDDIEKLLYIDTDVICKGNIDELFTMDAGDCPIAMADNIGISPILFDKTPIFDVWLTDLYCNNGVTMFYIKKYKEYESYDSLFKAFTNLVGKMRYPDQDFLNYHFHKKVHFIRQVYNFTLSSGYCGYESFKRCIEVAKLLHFISKPWRWKTKYSLKRLYFRYSIDKTVKKQVQKAIIKGFLLNPIYYLLFLVYQPFKLIKPLREFKERIFKQPK